MRLGECVDCGKEGIFVPDYEDGLCRDCFYKRRIKERKSGIIAMMAKGLNEEE